MTPSFTETIYFYLLSAGLLVVFGSIVQHRHLLGGLFVSELLFIVAPSLSYTIQKKYCLSHTYSLFPVSQKTAVLAGIIALAAFVLVGIIATLQELLLPRSSSYIEVWNQILAEFHQVPLIVAVFLVAILPGVCEELLFRGFLLRGIRQRYSDTTAVVVVGVLFGVFHLDPYRFLPVTLLGILFGYMVVKTGSLVPGMIAHAINNSISIAISYGAYQTQQGEMFTGANTEEFLTWEIIASAIVMLAIALPIFILSLRALPRSEHAEVGLKRDEGMSGTSPNEETTFELPPGERQEEDEHSNEDDSL